jgi:pyranose oxidase
MNHLEGDASLKTEVLVIGSGPIGCTFARFLVGEGRRVLMVDAGPQYSARPGAHLKNAFAYQRDVDRFAPIIQSMLHPLSVPARSEGRTTLDPIVFRPRRTIRSAQNPHQRPKMNLDAAAASYAVGGMFIHWTNNTPRHHPTLERIPFIGGREWNALYSLAESILKTNRDVFRPITHEGGKVSGQSIRHTVVKEVVQAHYGDRLPPDGGVQEMPVAGQRRTDNDEFVDFTGCDTILSPLIDEPGKYSEEQFCILPEHRVKKLFTNGRRVEGALVHDLIHGKEIRIQADLVVVAAGSILTPQILWNSEIRPPALGRYLTEHPLAFTQIVLSDEIVTGITRDLRFADLVAQVEDQDPVPIPMHDPPPSLMIPVCEGRPWHCQIQRDSFSYGALPADIDSRLVVDLRWFGMVDPAERNRVEFEQDLNDTFGMPKPTFKFSLGRGDRKRAHEMMKDMVGVAAALGGFLPGSEPRFMPPGLALHFQGTYRMGEQDDGRHVADPYSRVFGWENLYLGGNGLIPTSTASNPTLTSMALAIRAASSIVGHPLTGEASVATAAASGEAPAA